MLYKQNSSSRGIALNSVKISPNSQLIIDTDTGATNHMICNKNLFETIEMLNHDQYILVANGTKVTVTSIGTINLFSKNIKKCVIYKLIYNKSNLEFNCDVFFSKSNVKFQNQTTMVMIGEGFYDN